MDESENFARQWCLWNVWICDSWQKKMSSCKSAKLFWCVKLIGNGINTVHLDCIHILWYWQRKPYRWQTFCSLLTTCFITASFFDNSNSNIDSIVAQLSRNCTRLDYDVYDVLEELSVRFRAPNKGQTFNGVEKRFWQVQLCAGQNGWWNFLQSFKRLLLRFPTCRPRPVQNLSALLQSKQYLAPL